MLLLPGSENTCMCCQTSTTTQLHTVPCASKNFETMLSTVAPTAQGSLLMINLLVCGAPNPKDYIFFCFLQKYTNNKISIFLERTRTQNQVWKQQKGGIKYKTPHVLKFQRAFKMYFCCIYCSIQMYFLGDMIITWYSLTGNLNAAFRCYCCLGRGNIYSIRSGVNIVIL